MGKDQIFSYVYIFEEHSVSSLALILVISVLLFGTMTPAHNKIIQFGEIMLTMTSENFNVWQGGPKSERKFRQDLAMRRMRSVPAGSISPSMSAFKHLGDIAFSSEGDKNGKYGALLVGYDHSKIPNLDSPPLKESRGAELIYECKDVKNNGSVTGSTLRIYRPVPPDGYVSLGDYCLTKEPDEEWWITDPL